MTTHTRIVGCFKKIVLLPEVFNALWAAGICTHSIKQASLVRWQTSQDSWGSRSCISHIFATIDSRGQPQSRPVVITIFTQSVRPSVRPKTLKPSHNHCRPGLWGLAEWIIDDSCLVPLCVHISWNCVDHVSLIPLWLISIWQIQFVVEVPH